MTDNVAASEGATVLKAQTHSMATLAPSWKVAPSLPLKSFCLLLLCQAMTVQSVNELHLTLRCLHLLML